MNYLTEIKLFYDWLETHPLTPSAIALWHGLMFMANRSGWEEEITVPISVLESRTGISSATLYRIRIQLSEAGLITVSTQGGRACAKYRILSFESRFAPQNEKQNESQTGDKNEVKRESGEFVSQIEKQSESINKTKQDTNISQEKHSKKKSGRGKSFSADEWVATVESPWQELMRIWLEYKRSRKESYASEMGAKACLKKLQNLAGNSPEVAQAIIEQSMASNWAGLFPLSGQPRQGGSGGLTPATGQRIGQIMQPENEEHRNAILEKFKKKAAEDMSHRPGNPEKLQQ